MVDPRAHDFFDMARRAAAAGLMVAAALGMTSAFLKWVSITPPEIVPESQRAGTIPFSGLDVSPDGWIVLTGGIALMFVGGALWADRRSGAAWLGFLMSMVIGSIGVSRYREIGDVTSALSDKMGIVGDAKPALGILLVIAAGIVGLLSSVAGIAATPRRPDNP